MTMLAVNALIVIDGGSGTAQAIEQAGDLLVSKEGTATLLYLIPRAPTLSTVRTPVAASR